MLGMQKLLPFASNKGNGILEVVSCVNMENVNLKFSAMQLQDKVTNKCSNKLT